MIEFLIDKNKSQEAIDKFKDINEAYGVLSDENKRYVYDSFGDDYNYNSPSILSVKTSLLLATEILFNTLSSVVLSPLDSSSKRARSSPISSTFSSSPSSSHLFGGG